MSKERLESLLRQVQERRNEPRVRSSRTAAAAPVAAAPTSAAAAPAPARRAPRRRSATPLEQAVSRASGFAPSPPTSPVVPRKKSEPSFDSPAAQYAKQNAKAKSVAPAPKPKSIAPAPKPKKPSFSALKPASVQPAPIAAPKAEAIAVAPAVVPSAPIAQARGEKPAAKTFGELIVRALSLRP